MFFLAVALGLGWVGTSENPSGLLLCPVDERVFKGATGHFLSLWVPILFTKGHLREARTAICRLRNPEPLCCFTPKNNMAAKIKSHDQRRCPEGSAPGQPVPNKFPIYFPNCGNNVKLHLVARFRFRSPGECGVPLHCHYSQVHSDPEW